MPELPEVESFKRYIIKHATHKPIKDVLILGERVIKSPVSKFKQLKNTQITEVHRHGKYLFLLFTDITTNSKSNPNHTLMLHFGMTGNITHYKNGQELPDYTRLVFVFNDEEYFAFKNQRKFGKAKIVSSMDSFVKEKGLGPDALAIDQKMFLQLMKSKRGTLKYTLMKQEYLAGLGNIYTDETLFQTGLHPKTKVNALSQEQLMQLFDNVKYVLKTAVTANADFEQFPDDFIIPHRHTDQICPKCSTELKYIKVSGRGTYFCPSGQKKPLKSE